jgi:hypothetical protein
LRPPLVVAPDHEQLQRDDVWVEPLYVGQPRLFDDPARRLLQCIDGEDEAAGRGQRARGLLDNGRAVLVVDQQARRVRAELARDRELEANEPVLVDRGAVVLGEHRPERLALVHRDHGEGAALACDGVERRHSSLQPISWIPSSSRCPRTRGSVSVRISLSRSDVYRD